MANRASSAHQQPQNPPVLLFSEKYSQPCREVMAWLKRNPPARGALRCACIDGQVEMVPPSVTGVPALYVPDTGAVLMGDMMMATLMRIVNGGGAGQNRNPPNRQPSPRRRQGGGARGQAPPAEPEQYPYETAEGYEYVGLKDSGDGVLVFDEEDRGLQFFASADGDGPVPPGAAYPRTDGGAPSDAQPPDSGKPRKLADNTLEMILQERSREMQDGGQPGGGGPLGSGPARFADARPQAGHGFGYR